MWKRKNTIKAAAILYMDHITLSTVARAICLTVTVIYEKINIHPGHGVSKNKGLYLF